MSIVQLARPEIQALNPYQAATQVDGTVRLNANEAPWAVAATHFRRPLNRYPEIRPARLQATLANRYGCRPDQLLVTRGSSEAIDLLIRTFCRAGQDNIVTTAPTFSMYAHYAAIQGAQLKAVTTDPDCDFALDVERLLGTCDEKTRLIFLCTPNNPTGTSIQRGDIEALLQGREDRSALVVDEAYIEFSTEASTTELLERYGNLVVLRTLSKAPALAGARCGAVIGSAEVVAMLNAVQAPYALATPVVEHIEAALEEEQLAESAKRINTINAERERMMIALARFPFVRRLWPSQANFFLAELENPRQVLVQTIADNVLLRHFEGDLSQCVRITVGLKAENERLLQSLSKVALS